MPHLERCFRVERARRCHLVVVGVEVGGRFGAEAATWLRLLAGQRALEVPAPLRAAARAAWVARWSGLLAVAAQRAIAASLLELPLECNLAGDAPELHEVLADVRWQLPVLGSRQVASADTDTPGQVQKGAGKKKKEKKLVYEASSEE